MTAYATTVDRATLRAALQATHGIALLRDVLADATNRSVLALLTALAVLDPSPESVADAYGRAFSHLAAAALADPLGGVADAWQAHLTARLLDDANPWSAQAEASGRVPPGLEAQAIRELRALRLLFNLPAEAVHALARDAVVADLPPLADAWVPWTDLATAARDDAAGARAAMRRRLCAVDDWAALAGELGRYWARHGSGLVARYHALRWDGQAGALVGIAHPDPIRLADLVGYETVQGLLTANVRRFLAGLPAHDALLYGAPGTGKSSTVKAIANAYADRGLRLVEVRKEDLHELPAITAALRGRAPRFLLFVDDLSFEEHQTEYKALKALLEGAAEARPRNVLIYATTNRRNLVRESFGDRGLPSEDVHGRDTMQEKVSLAARFGLRVTFSAPDQEGYLAIAVSLARGRGLPLSDEAVRARALLWERQHPGRSGRTARQFVDDLEAELRARELEDAAPP